MKSLNLQFGDNRQNQREDMFIANIAEKVSSGKLSMIPFVDQAQFIDLITKKQKKKVKLQPIFSKVFTLIKDNIAKHQQSQQKIQEVSYEIKTISSTRQLGNRSSFNVGNKSGALLFRKDSNMKDQQTYEFSEKEIITDDISKTARSSKHIKLQQLTDEKLDRRIKTSREDTQENHVSTGRNEKNTFNLQTEEHTDNSLMRMESQQSCALPLDRLHALQTNFTTEISNANTKNHSATFQQPTSQRGSFGIINNETTKNKPDVILKTIKGGFPNQGYLIQEQNKKPITAQNVIKKNFSNPKSKQISVTPRSKNASKASNHKQSVKNARESPENKKITEQKQEQKIEIKVSPGIPQESQLSEQKTDQKILQLQLNQETSFCGNIAVSQRAIKTDIDDRHQDSPQFNKNETGEDVAISHSAHHSIPRSARQTISYKQDVNPLNISQNSFQSKRHTIDQPDYNSLLPPQSSRTLRTLTSARKDKTTEPRNSISNISEEQKPSQNQLSVNFKRGSKRMKSHNVQGNETEFNTEENERRYSQERIFKSDNRFERLVDERYQYTVNNLERTQSSSSLNNQEQENQNQINIQVSRCDNREKIIEEESIDGSMQHNNGILFATQDRMHLKIGDNSFLPQSSSRSVVKSISPHTPAGSINTVQHSSSGTATNQQNQNVRRRKQQQIQNQPRRVQLSGDQSQTKIQYAKQKSEDSNYEKEYTNESSLEPEKPTRLKPKKPQKLMPPALALIQPQRRKSSAQVSPMDPRKAEQQDRENQKKIEYQKMIDKMRLERELLMEQYKIADDMTLPQKKVIIESLINELNHQTDQDVQYQVSLYNQRQDQIQNIQRNYEEKIDFRYNIVNSCYYEIDYLCDHKLKLKQNNQENQKNIHLKFQDQFANHAQKNHQGDDKIDDEESSPYKKANKITSSYDPVEIENYLKRKFEFVQETQLLHFLKQFESEFNKQVYQCHLDQPILQDNPEDKNFTKGLLPRQMKRKQTKHISTKIEINNYQMDINKMDYVKQKANRIQKMGQFLLMNS